MFFSFLLFFAFDSQREILCEAALRGSLSFQVQLIAKPNTGGRFQMIMPETARNT
jgi:hypothetical protein